MIKIAHKYVYYICIYINSIFVYCFVHFFQVTPIKSIDDNILKTAVNDFERDDTYNISGCKFITQYFLSYIYIYVVMHIFMSYYLPDLF